MDDFKQAYQNLLKKNTQLEAEKRQIINAAANRITQAEDEIKKLHACLNTVVQRAQYIVSYYFKPHANHDKALADMQTIGPLKIGGKTEIYESSSH